MLNCYRIAAGLIAVWAILGGVLTSWPDTRLGDRHMQAVYINGAPHML